MSKAAGGARRFKKPRSPKAKERHQEELDRQHSASQLVRCTCTRGRPCKVECVRCATGRCPGRHSGNFQQAPGRR